MSAWPTGAHAVTLCASQLEASLSPDTMYAPFRGMLDSDSRSDLRAVQQVAASVLSSLRMTARFYT